MGGAVEVDSSAIGVGGCTIRLMAVLAEEIVTLSLMDKPCYWKPCVGIRTEEMTRERRRNLVELESIIGSCNFPFDGEFGHSRLSW